MTPKYASGLPRDVDAYGQGPQPLWQQRHSGPSYAERILGVLD